MYDLEAVQLAAASHSKRLALELGSNSHGLNALVMSGANILSEDALSKVMASVRGVKDSAVQKNLAEMLLGRHMSNGHLMVSFERHIMPYQINVSEYMRHL